VKLNERYDEWQSLHEEYNLWKWAAKGYAGEKRLGTTDLGNYFHYSILFSTCGL
jgi:hypothetical protein